MNNRRSFLLGSALFFAVACMLRVEPNTALAQTQTDAGQRRPKARAKPPDPEPETYDIPAEWEKQPEEQPRIIRWMVHPRRRGMFVNLPIVDTDPNRGITYGIMPIWVVQGETDDRIRHIHAPSVTYNETFRINSIYRYYYYPTKDSSLLLLASISQVVDKEFLAQYDDFRLLGTSFLTRFKLQSNINGAGRFYGIGPNTPSSGESNYVNDTLNMSLLFGFPVYKDSRWYIHASQALNGQKVSNGPVDALPDIDKLYPLVAPAHRHQSSVARLALNYDSRDNPITTAQGAYADFFWETSQRRFASEYTYRHFGTDLRYFHRSRREPRLATAGRIRFQQMLGEGLPFWLLPQLGGKYVHRAYGEGRYVDYGLLVASLEERFTLFEIKTAGVKTSYELDPFTELGTVFDAPGKLARKYMRPVYGASLRAVAPPQVVGSVDFGVGQEGLSVFMDVNYSF
ncbi:MAG: BamA/TamA family outer membrane protein [Elusimicrobia bacterium]|nr:BamA/TamA family outer membrane protein [Elusimicrobiota bacterium]